jgi:hypothetical protein
MGDVFTLYLHLLFINSIPQSGYINAMDAANNAVSYLKPKDNMEIQYIMLLGDEFKDVDYIYVLQYINPSNDYSNDTMYFEDREKMINFITSMCLEDFKSTRIPVWYGFNSNFTEE